MGKSKKKKGPKAVDSNDILLKQDQVEKENTVIQKAISSFGARMHMIRHLLSRI